MPVAFVVLREGSRVPAEAERREIAGARLAAYRLPERIPFVPELAHTAVGKRNRPLESGGQPLPSPRRCRYTGA